MNLAIRRLAALAILLTLAAPAGAVELRYKLKAGEKLVYRDQLALAFDSQAADAPKSQLQIRSNSKIEERVTKVEDGVATMDLKTTENTTTRTSPGGGTDKIENPGHPERIKLAANGKVVKRESLDKDDSGPGPGFTSMLDEFAILQQVLDNLTYPDGDVQPGATWDQTIAVDLTPESGNLHTMVNVKPTTTLKRLVVVNGETCAEIITDFEIPLEPPKNEMSKEMKLGLDGKIVAHLVTYFAVDRGRALVELSTIGAAARVSMSPPGGGERVTIRGRMKLNIKTVLEH